MRSWEAAGSVPAALAELWSRLQTLTLNLTSLNQPLTYSEVVEIRAKLQPFADMWARSAQLEWLSSLTPCSKRQFNAFAFVLRVTFIREYVCGQLRYQVYTQLTLKDVIHSHRNSQRRVETLERLN